jgi:hypothetical protein
MKKWMALAVVALLIVAAVQLLIGSLRKHDFESELGRIALTVTADNHEEIKRRVAAVAAKLGATTSADKVGVQYAATKDLSGTQRFVAKLMEFDNHRATITVEFSQPILFLPIKKRSEVTALIESAGRQRPPQGLPEP